MRRIVRILELNFAVGIRLLFHRSTTHQSKRSDPSEPAHRTMVKRDRLAAAINPLRFAICITVYCLNLDID